MTGLPPTARLASSIAVETAISGQRAHVSSKFSIPNSFTATSQACLAWSKLQIRKHSPRVCTISRHFWPAAQATHLKQLHKKNLSTVCEEEKTQHPTKLWRLTTRTIYMPCNQPCSPHSYIHIYRLHSIREGLNEYSTPKRKRWLPQHASPASPGTSGSSFASWQASQNSIEESSHLPQTHRTIYMTCNQFSHHQNCFLKKPQQYCTQITKKK